MLSGSNSGTSSILQKHLLAAVIGSYGLFFTFGWQVNLWSQRRKQQELPSWFCQSRLNSPCHTYRKRKLTFLLWISDYVKMKALPWHIMLNKWGWWGGLHFRKPLKLLENEQTFRQIHAGVTDPDRSCPHLTHNLEKLIGEWCLWKDGKLKQV